MSWGEWKINRRDMLRLSFGTVPFLAWRFSLLDYYPGVRERAPHGAMAYLRRFYYDLAHYLQTHMHYARYKSWWVLSRFFMEATIHLRYLP